MLFFLPYRNTRSVKKFPAVTYALIIANVFLYIALIPIDRAMLADTMGFLPSALTLKQIISSMFVHGAVLHLLWNMFFLWLFGPSVEDALGHFEYALLYIGSGFAAALLQVAMIEALIPVAGTTPVIGASGAISGILGVFAVRFYRTGIKSFYFLGFKTGISEIPAMFVVGIWFLQQIIGGIMDIAYQGSGGIAYWSHIGGMIFGITLAYLFSMFHEGSAEYLQDDIRKSVSDGDVSVLEKRLVANPMDADLMMELAALFMSQKENEKALGYYRQAICQYQVDDNKEKAVAARAEMRHYFPDDMIDPHTDYQIARFLLDMDCHDAALKMFDSIHIAYPSSPEAELSLMMSGDLCLYTLDDLYAARTRYEQFRQRYPGSHLWAMVEKSWKEANEKIRIMEKQTGE